MGFSDTVSARALKVAGTSFSGFFQKNGTRPQRMLTSSRWPSASSLTTSIIVVGAIL